MSTGTRSKVKCERFADAEAIAKGLAPLYPSYRYEVKRWPRERKWSIAVYCKATGALLLSTIRV